MEKSEHHQMEPKHYRLLLLMTVVSFICMYVLMYSMADQFANVISNFNQFYMAAVMTAPMPIVMILTMQSMYKNKKLNLLTIMLSLAGLIVFFFCIRTQAGIGDRQFIKSMIPHHASAIQMVKHADLRDTAVQRLARNIISNQQKEIEFMKAKLKEMDK